MKYFDLLKDKLSSLWPMWLVIMLAAIWSIYIQDGQINRDGLLYLKQAYFFAEGSWQEGLALYPWPFFSILIALVHKLTKLHLQFVAHGVDLILFGIAALFYLKTLQLIHKEKQIIFYGGIIFLSFIPIMDDYVGMILRDHGLWAGCMMGTYFYFKSLQNSLAFQNNLFWQFSFVLGGAFRPEALIFLFTMPIFTIFFTNHNCWKKYFFKLLFNQFLLIIVSLFFILLIAVTGNLDFSIILTGRMEEFGPRILLFYKQLISPISITSENDRLNLLFQNNQIAVSFILLSFLFLIKLIKGSGILFLILIYSHFKKGLKENEQFLKPLYFFIIISLSLIFMTFSISYVLTNRYFIFTYFWIMILVTPELLSFFKAHQNKKNKIRNAFVVIFIVVYILNVLIDQNRPSIEMKSGNFLKGLHLNGSVGLINAERIAYYAGFSIKEILQSSSNNTDNKDWIILYTKDKLHLDVPLGYDIFNKFEHKDQIVVFFKKRA